MISTLRKFYHQIRAWQDARFLRRLSEHLRQAEPEAFQRLSTQVDRYRTDGALSHPLQAYKLWELERTLFELEPRRILELGTGSTTPIFAAYVLGHPDASLVAVDETERWIHHTRELLPEEARTSNQVKLHHSPRVVTSGPGGVEIRYEALPEGDFDLVFVDGPSLQGEDGRKILGAVNSDVRELVHRSPPATVVVDMRRDTVRWFAETYRDDYEARISDRILGRRSLDYRYLTRFSRRSE
ncbi:MAG: hypothetical protein WEA09_03975 [Gemmatimonadota bacterium]